MKKATILLVFLFLLLSLPLPGWAESEFPPVDYENGASWVLRPEGESDLPADVFFLLPTVNMKDMRLTNEDITDERAASRYGKTLNMEKGVFDGVAAVYAPYYRQKTFGTYCVPDADPALGDIAYGDVKDAFSWYLAHKDPARPFFIFGFSQGAEMGLRLLMDVGGEPAVAEKLIAAYLIGWTVTAQDTAACPWLRMAQGEGDTNVIVSFECVGESTVYEGPKALAINPLNWRTDAFPALPEENLGFVQADITGAVVREIEHFCGAYLDETTGLLIATHIENPEEWAASGLAFLPDGSYHLYEINFFFNNLRENALTRSRAWYESQQ